MTLSADLHQAVRSLSRQKRFTAVVLLTLGVAIGANASVFQVVNLTLLRPLPFENADRLFRIQATVNRPSGAPGLTAISPQAFVHIREAHVFERVVAQRVDNLVLHTRSGDVERVAAVGIEAGWLPLFGLQPALGRGFTGEEERLGTASTAVLLSHSLWQRSFGADPGILGRAIVLDDRDVTVVGVMPAAFNYPYHAELWRPITVNPNAVTPANLNVIGRLRASEPVESARAQLRALAIQLAQENPQANAGRSLEATPLRTDLTENQDSLLLAVLVAVAFVLLIAAANVSSLMLTRAINRRNEMAVRAALGATRGQRFRTVFCESVVIAALGGLLGALIASWATSLSTALLPKDFRELGELTAIDGRLIAFTLAATAIAAVIFGLLPALRLSGNGGLAALGSGTRLTSERGDRRWLSSVVVAQVSLALLLLVGALQMLQFVKRIETVDVGYETAGALSIRVPLSDRRLPTADSRMAFLGRVLEELRGVPGVARVGLTSLLPIGGGNQLAAVSIEGQPPNDPARLSVNHRIVDADFFETMGMPLLAGRTFDDRDRAGNASVAIVSRALADRLWPGEPSLGKRLKRGRPDDASPWLTVVGVVGNVREPREAGPESWYLPYTQQVAGFTGAVQPTLVIRATADPGQLADAARRAVGRVDSSVPVFQIATLEELQSVFYRQERLGTSVMTLFASAGLLLALLGVHGITTYLVTQRMQEIGVRMAFGADRPQIIWMIVRQAGMISGLGLAAGLVAASTVSRSLDRLVPGIQPAPISLLVTPMLMLASVTTLAALLPAWKATRMDPLSALRDR